MLKKEQTTDNKTICKIAEQWLKTPFRWHGITKKGCDCAGFIIGVFRELDIIEKEQVEVFQKLYYGNNLNKIIPSIIDAFMLFHFDFTLNIKEADILQMKTKNSSLHFAIFKQKTNQIIHCTRNNGVVINNFNQNEYEIIYMWKMQQTTNENN